ncbi:MAG: hypothetical protein DRN15_11105 [Thermoprotei archaeon]|nr:MAG: hypothetical protein DRN15_11105 [Thermoprotei archaeon]
MRIAFSVPKATSIHVQARLVEKRLSMDGHSVMYRSFISVYDVLHGLADSYMWFFIMNPTWVNPQAPAFIFAKEKADGRVVAYATIEGIPYPTLVQATGTKYVEYTANSYFTKECLEKVGYKVVDVVHHAIDLDEVERAVRLAGFARRKIKTDFKDRVVFCYVGRDDHRKQLDRLMKAVDILNERRGDDFVLLMHTELRRPKLFERPNVYITSQFGQRPHYEVLALIAACDYMVFPSVCEGFGVPVLESMAVGTPVVHCWFPPLSEFSLKEANITFDYIDEEFWKTSAEQYFWMHMYDPQDLADAMERAIDIYKNYKSDYEDRRAKLREHARRWDYRIVYSKFARKLGGG